MSYQLRAPTEDPVVLELRRRYRRLEVKQRAVMDKLEKLYAPEAATV